jgi:hypothetical protein
MLRISRFKKLNLWDILPQAYLILTQKQPSEEMSFIQFIDKVLPMLEDFNQMDMNLVDPDKTFDNLKAIYDLRNWDPTAKDLPQTEDELIPLMKDLYYSLYRELSEKKTGYQGMIYREAAKQIESFIRKDTHLYLFGGLSLLSRSESLVIENILINRRGSIYWDLPTNTKYDKQLFPYSSEWTYYRSHNFADDCLGNTPIEKKNIQFISVEGNATLSKHIPQVSKNLQGKTGIILANQQLLPALLKSWKDPSELNVSIGIPAFQYPVSEFIDSLIQFRLSHQIPLSNISLKDIIEIFSNPFITHIFPETPQLLEDLIHEYGNTININRLNEKITEKKALAEIMQSISTEEDLIRHLLDIIDIILPYTERGIQTDILYQYHKSLISIGLLTEKYPFLKEIEPLIKYIRNVFSHQKIQLKGSADARYQIIGFQEAQLIPFDNILIAPVNEGVIPRSRYHTGYITPDLKRNLGMPDKRARMAIDTYHYNQLFRQSSHVVCLFSSKQDVSDTGEPARYIQQSLWKHPEMNIWHIAPTVPSAPTSTVVIPSNNDIRKKVLSLLDKGISASMITSYLYNPVEFYHKYILGLSEPDKPDAVMPASTMGTLLHSCLENLYAPFINRFMSSDDYSGMLRKLDVVLQKEYRRITLNPEPVGAEVITYKVIKRYIEKFLSHEKNLVEQGSRIKITGLEKKYKLSWYSEALKKNIHIRGNIDRIDELNGTIRIIDYKTGAVKPGETSIPALAYTDLFNGKKLKGIQLLFYLLLYCRGDKKCNDIQAGIISFRNFSSGIIPLSLGDRKDKTYLLSKEHIINFESLLDEFITRLIDPSHKFIEVIRDKYGNPIP